jgi:hypothetical protein
MLHSKTFLRVAICGAMMSTFCFAQPYTGIAYLVSNSVASNAILSNVPTPGTDPNNVTFTASGLNFSSFGNITNTGNGNLDYGIDAFITSLGDGSGLTNHGSITSNTTMDGGTVAPPTTGGMGVIFEFTGMANFTTGQSFNIEHDDGVTLIVGGQSTSCAANSGPTCSLIVSVPGPTGATPTPVVYNGPTGNQSFTFVYGECCGAPAVFETTLVPATTPEPTSIVLFGTTLLGVGTLVRRKYRKLG